MPSAFPLNQSHVLANRPRGFYCYFASCLCMPTYNTQYTLTLGYFVHAAMRLAIFVSVPRPGTRMEEERWCFLYPRSSPYSPDFLLCAPWGFSSCCVQCSPLPVSGLLLACILLAASRLHPEPFGLSRCLDGMLGSGGPLGSCTAAGCLPQLRRYSCSAYQLGMWTKTVI